MWRDVGTAGHRRLTPPSAVASIAFEVPACRLMGTSSGVTPDCSPPRSLARRQEVHPWKWRNRLGQDPDASRGLATSPRPCSTWAHRLPPASPGCALCPGGALRRKANLASQPSYPGGPKTKRPFRHGVHFWLPIRRKRLARRRPDPVCSAAGGAAGDALDRERWSETEPCDTRRYDGMAASGQIKHGFTHFELTSICSPPGSPRSKARIVHPVARLSEIALPSVMRKCVRALAVALTPLPRPDPRNFNCDHRTSRFDALAFAFRAPPSPPRKRRGLSQSKLGDARFFRGDELKERRVACLGCSMRADAA